MSKTVAQIKADVLTQVFVSGTPENLVTSIREGVRPVVDLIFDEAFAEIAKWVPCEREKNVTVVKFCNTHFKCGMTVVEQPRGIIGRVYTVADDDWCSPVSYQETDWPAPECLASSLVPLWESPDNTGLPKLPLGFKRAESTTDRDPNGNLFPRAGAGVWAKNDDKIWVSPWMQSNEKLVIEWKGIKTTWSDDDLVSEDQDYRKALKLYVQYVKERDYGDPNLAMTIHDPRTGRGTFDEALADLMWECRERQKRHKNLPQAPRTSFSCAVLLPASNESADSAARPAAGHVVSGRVLIPEGAENGSVNSMFLPANPLSIYLTVQSPSGGLIMFPVLVGEVRTTGFDYQLSGITDGPNYWLHYTINLP